MEFSIALADLGNPAPGSMIKIAAMINNGDHNYLSNQILGRSLQGRGIWAAMAAVDSPDRSAA